jgi:hypothetical protein
MVGFLSYRLFFKTIPALVKIRAHLEFQDAARPKQVIDIMSNVIRRKESLP